MSEQSRTPQVWNKYDPKTPADAFYCGRGSPAGNPLKIGIDGTRDEVCDKYIAWASAQPDLMAYFKTLKGKDLVCFCVPRRCHVSWIFAQANPDLVCDDGSL